MSEFKPRYLAFGGRGQRGEITPRGRVYWGGEWTEAEREEARRVDEEMSGQQTVEEARLHGYRLEVWRQFARYSVSGEAVREDVDAAIDAYVAEALRECEAEVERLREAMRGLVEAIDKGALVERRGFRHPVGLDMRIQTARAALGEGAQP